MEQPHRGQHIDVVAAVLVDDLTRPMAMLAGHRRDHPAGAGWELPGGKLEPGESMHGALHRELAEELGITARLGAQLVGPLLDGRWELSHRHMMLVWFAQITGGAPQPLEAHDELRWLRHEQLYDVGWLPGDYPIIEALAAALHPVS